jgi:ferritin
MLKTTIQNALNQQIIKEMYSSNLYLSMASYFAEQNLNGFAAWMHIQAMEEMTHAIKFFDYIIARGGKAVIGSIAAPPVEWESPFNAFQSAYNHEQYVTEWINELVDIALNEKDHASYNMLQWFVNEQVEEEANTSLITDKLKLIGNDSSALFFLDNELGKRPVAAAVAATAI